MSIGANRIRIALEITNALNTAQLVDAISSLTPLVPRARAVQFECALFNNGKLDGLALLTSITLEIKDTNASGFIDPNGTIRVSKTIAAVNFNPTLTQDQWDNDDGAKPYHFIVSFSEAEMTAIPAIGAADNKKNYGMTIVGLTASGRVTLGSGLVTAIDDGGTGAGATIPPAVAYTMTDQEIQAGLATKLNAGDNPAGTFLILRDGATGKGILLRAVVDPGAAAARLGFEQV